MYGYQPTRKHFNGLKGTCSLETMVLARAKGTGDFGVIFILNQFWGSQGYLPSTSLHWLMLRYEIYPLKVDHVLNGNHCFSMSFC
jgi:hypothetical protein